MPTDIADVIKDINKRLIAAEGQIFGFTQLVHALVASNSVNTVILREHIELLRSRLVPADETDEATALYIEAARDLMSEMLNQEGLQNAAGAFCLGRLSDTGQGGKRILRAGRWQGLGALRNETAALRLSPWSDPTTSAGSKSRSPLKP